MGKPNIQRKIQNIMGKIVENVLKKGYPCIVDGCKESAINSHLLMINGILNNVAEDGHLIEVCTESPYSFSLQKNNEKKFKRIGVKQAFSLPIFCDLHDTTIFREIEQNEPIFTNYKHLALYTYRTICAEIRKKEQAHEICNRIISSKTLHNLMSEDFFENLKIHNLGYERGIYELKQYNQDLFDDIKGDTEHFCFVSLEISPVLLGLPTNHEVSSQPKVPICLCERSADFEPPVFPEELKSVWLVSTHINVLPGPYKDHSVL